LPVFRDQNYPANSCEQCLMIIGEHNSNLGQWHPVIGFG
jgi:hypothetical protein